MLALIRGAGDIASGAAMRLWRCGIDVVMTDLARPTAIRRTVAFSNAIVHGETTVEGLRAVRAENAAEAKKLLREGSLPVLADPECACRKELAPDALVDAILAKRNLGTKIDDAPIVVGVGPGFTAGEDCHAVVETMRGHTLGRVIYSGSALPNTNIPGLIGGFAGERVLRAPCDGIFTAVHRIGDTVEEGETIGFVEGQPMKCTISGVLRGVLDDGVPVKKGMKSGDVDPRCKPEYCTTISDKALAVGSDKFGVFRRSGILNYVNGKSVFESAKILRDKFQIERDDGTKPYFKLLSNDFTENIYQVTHQVTVTGLYTNRYDVTLLVNGLPLVQIELKRRGVDLKEAVNQIMRYRKHSYQGLFHFIQIFVVSNGVDSKYFANSDKLQIDRKN